MGVLIPGHWMTYINEHILLKNESLDILSAHAYNDLVDVPVIKRTARTRRVTAKLTIGCHHYNVPPAELVQAYHSPYTKKQMTDTEEFYHWMKQGWIIREYRFGKDEKTVKAERSRMGYVLFQYKQQLAEKEKAALTDQLKRWAQQWEQTPQIGAEQSPVQKEAINIFKHRMERISETVAQFLQEEKATRLFPDLSWAMNKQMAYIEFLLAFYRLAVKEEYFDWKQIGATFYQTIGGSKQFDRYKDEFINQTEKLLDRPLHLLGLASIGTVTPIMFTGKMEGDKACYQYGPVHATTDSAVFTDNFKTDARVLWLVENRGVLTRMAYETAFLQETKSFVLSLDGQLRSGHARLITQLVRSADQVIIWTDVDEAGLVIAKDVYKTVRPSCQKVKWIIPQQAVVTSLEQFERAYHAAIQTKKIEQEQEMGGVEDWRKWINH